MGKRLVAVIGTLAAVALLGVPSASAAVEFGDACAGNEMAPPPGNYTIVNLTATPNGLSPTAPSAGVITEVRLKLGPFTLLGGTTTIKAVRAAGPEMFTTLGQAEVSVGPGISSADARIPVQAGDRLALHGTTFGSLGENSTYYCVTSDGSQIGAAFGDVPVGATAEFEQVEEGRIPASAVLEPDADNDGFGDETQDQCPQVAATQGPCPPAAAVVTVDAAKVIKKKGSVVVLVTTSSPATVTVNGTVKLGKRKKAKLGSKAQTIQPGKVSSFTLRFTKALKKKLRKLPRKRSLRLDLTASATDSIGRVTTDRLRTRLKGQKKAG